MGGWAVDECKGFRLLEGKVEMSRFDQFVWNWQMDELSENCDDALEGVW